MASRFGQKVAEFKNPRRKSNCWSRRTRFLSTFSKCLVSLATVGREKKIPVENSQKKTPGREFKKKNNPGREFTKKLPVENLQKKTLGRNTVRSC